MLTNINSRHLLRKIMFGVINKYISLFEENVTNNKCIIFAPHQDDEVLGCGGVIIQKKRQGADVKIVFMTDGNNSHKNVSNLDLRDIRKQEAIKCACELGLSENDIIFLDFIDGTLSEQIDVASNKVIEILNKLQPAEIFFPYIGDGHPDHIATNISVLNAVKKYNNRIITYEYPTWFMNSWPFTEQTNELGIYKNIKQNIIFILKVIRDFRFSVKITDVTKTKCNALSKHRTQIERYNNSQEWPVLSDISNGQWLEWFFCGYEIFHKNSWNND